jgi:hypothetical protein
MLAVPLGLLALAAVSGTSDPLPLLNTTVPIVAGIARSRRNLFRLAEMVLKSWQGCRGEVFHVGICP